MTTLTFTADTVVARDLADVYAYVADFAHARQWRAEVVESSATPPGPAQVGTQLHEVARVAGRRVVTDSVVDVVDAPHRWRFTHVSGPLPVSGENRFEAVPGGTRYTYELRVSLPGAWRLLAPVLRRTGPRTMAASLATLRDRLEAAVPVRRPSRRRVAQGHRGVQAASYGG